MEKIINGNRYVVAAETWNTSHAWGHNGYVFRNGEIIAKNRVRYYNRAWEGYYGQSVMRGAVSNRISSLENEAVARYKAANGIKRITAKRRAEAISKCGEICELRELLASI